MAQLSNTVKYLVPHCVERADGVGEVMELGTLRSKLLVVTLGISDVLEREGLVVSIWGSASDTAWGDKPLLRFPQKSYCGVYCTFLNLASHPEVRFVRVEWKMSRWSKRDGAVMFGFYVCMEESRVQIQSAVA